MNLSRLMFWKKPEPETKEKVNRAWLCIEMTQRDGTPYDYRELQITAQTKITWTNRSGVSTNLHIEIREEDRIENNVNAKEPIVIAVSKKGVER
jgi:hypothetical protein